MGMCHEFVSMDASGLRTSADYIFKGWRNSVPTRATIEAMGYWKEAEAADTESRMYIGSEDFLYKISDEHGGYVGYSNGKELGAQTESGFAGSSQGWKYIKQVWDKYLKRDYTASAQVSAADGTVNATITFGNPAGLEQQANVLVTVYDTEGKLIDLVSQSYDIGVDGSTVEFSSNGAKAMVFTQDDARGLELIGQTL